MSDVLKYDNTGKIDLNGIYDRTDPTRYFSTLRKLDYRIPGEAKPIFERIIQARREAQGHEDAKVVDIGCSYGVNAALIKHGLTMDDLYRLYDASQVGDREALIERDRKIFADPTDDNLAFVGLDSAANAIGYAVEAGALDAGLAANLEARDPRPAEAAPLTDTDLIISTGCFGYVTEKSLERLVEAADGSRPWMAHFVLRMFPFDEAAAMLAEHGYVTEKVEGLYRQRRFASAEEREHVLDNLAGLGIDASDAETDGWYFAELHLSRPAADELDMPIARLFEGASARRLN